MEQEERRATTRQRSSNCADAGVDVDKPNRLSEPQTGPRESTFGGPKKLESMGAVIGPNCPQLAFEQERSYQKVGAGGRRRPDLEILMNF